MNSDQIEDSAATQQEDRMRRKVESVLELLKANAPAVREQGIITMSGLNSPLLLPAALALVVDKEISALKRTEAALWAQRLSSFARREDYSSELLLEILHVVKTNPSEVGVQLLGNSVGLLDRELVVAALAEITVTAPELNTAISLVLMRI